MLKGNTDFYGIENGKRQQQFRNLSHQWKLKDKKGKFGSVRRELQDKGSDSTPKKKAQLSSPTTTPRQPPVTSLGKSRAKTPSSTASGSLQKKKKSISMSQRGSDDRWNGM